MKKRCMDCKHWYRERHGLDYPYGEKGVGEHVWRACQRIPFADSVNNIDMAYVVDGSMYAATLITRSEFFCSHFEER